MNLETKEEDIVLKLELTMAETNRILGALQDKPFKEVNNLVTKIVEQAKSQLDEEKKE